jgi:hypothetical protein
VILDTVSISLAEVLEALSRRRAVDGLREASLEGVTGVVGARELIVA